MTEEKTVLEAFRRTVTELVHLTIGGEVITTTHNHPFYVAGKGFVNAGKLRTCDILLDSKQNKLTIDDISFETSEEPTTVYNFKVKGYHTYYVGEKFIFVHNAECTPLTSRDRSQLKEETEWSDDVIEHIETKEQADIYKNANLTETEVNGRKCLVKDIDMDYVDPKTKLTTPVHFIYCINGMAFTQRNTRGRKGTHGGGPFVLTNTGRTQKDYPCVSQTIMEVLIDAAGI